MKPRGLAGSPSSLRHSHSLLRCRQKAKAAAGRSAARCRFRRFGFSMSMPLFVLLVPCLALQAMLMPLFSGGYRASSWAEHHLPWVCHGQPVRDAPMVELRGAQLLIDGSEAGRTEPITRRERVAIVPEMVELLARKAELYEAFKEEPCPGYVVLEIPADTPTVVVKSLVASAAQAGFPDVDFVVRNWCP